MDVCYLLRVYNIQHTQLGPLPNLRTLPAWLQWLCDCRRSAPLAFGELWSFRSARAFRRTPRPLGLYLNLILISAFPIPIT